MILVVKHTSEHNLLVQKNEFKIFKSSRNWEILNIWKLEPENWNCATGAKILLENGGWKPNHKTLAYSCPATDLEDKNLAFDFSVLFDLRLSACMKNISCQLLAFSFVFFFFLFSQFFNESMSLLHPSGITLLFFKLDVRHIANYFYVSGHMILPVGQLHETRNTKKILYY